MLELAEMVEKAAQDHFDINAKVEHVDNPRVEAEEHYFSAVYTALQELGLEPHLLTDKVIADILQLAIDNKDRLKDNNVMNSPSWK